jgi:phosphohistidine swiveling domain-containing protein
MIDGRHGAMVGTLAKQDSILMSLGTSGVTAAAVGGNPSSPHELINAGFAVPSGFVVPADANLIKAQLDAPVSGVVFSINPHTGREEHALVECRRNSGDHLVSGHAAPTQYVMRLEDGHVIERKADAEDMPLGDETLRKLCRHALEIQAHFGTPQEIEWALDRTGKLWVLRSRPIARIHWRCETDEFTNANFRDGGVAARVCTPLMYSLYRDGFQGSMQRYFRAIKLLPKKGPQRCWINMFYGRPYWCSSAVKEALSKVPGYEEQRFDRDLGIQKNYGSAGPTKKPMTPMTLVAALPVAFALEREYRRQLRLTEHYEQRFVRDEAHYLRVAESFATLPNDEFLSTLISVLRFHERVEADYLTTVYNHVNYQADFDKLLGRISNATGERMSSVVLMSGLLDVAHMGIQHGFVKLVDTGRQQGINSAAWNVTLADFLQANFHHGDNELDISAPRWGEHPECIKKIVANVLHAGIELKNAETASHEQFELYSVELQRVTAILRRSLWCRLRFDKSFRKRLKTARTYASRRERMREYSTRAGCVMRRYALEAGQRFRRDGWLSQEEDVFMLHTEDLRSIAEHRAVKQRILALTEFRRLMYRGYQMLEPPGELGKGISQRSPDPLLESSSTALLKGTGCSAGKVKARARVITNFSETQNLNSCEILVTRSTDPSWTPIFGLVSGIVTEVGGLLSHGAVLAREYGLPAVFNVPRALRLIKTGQMLEIDGALGTVRILTNDQARSSTSLSDAECVAEVFKTQVASDTAGNECQR